MNSYEAKEHYKDDDIAQQYNAQYEAPLSLSNMMSKFYGWREEKVFQKCLLLALIRLQKR